MTRETRDNILGNLMIIGLWVLLILIVAGIVGFEVWEFIVQLNYDGKFIQWRFIPLW